MRFPIGVVLIAVGVVLLVLGINESQSIASDFSKFFTGNPTDKSVWFMMGGIVSLILGATTAFVPPRLFKR